ncbi:MAG: LacI family DNA-binding transcriptional regulator, partial [Betaproteobacteria bacterium]
MRTRAKSPATLRDVARVAGVSPATASRALSTPAKVRAATLARVLAAAHERGYVLDGAARALRQGRTRTIGAVIPTLDNAIFANATHALQKALAAQGHTLLLACHEFDLAAEVHVARQLIERGVDGLVLVGLDHRLELFHILETAAMPYLLTWALDRSGRHACVGFDNREAAMRMVRYLLDIGHRDFAMIAGETAHNDRARSRFEGVVSALAAAGLAPSPDRFVERVYTFAAGRDGMRALAALSPRPTAIICGNDVLAIGALAECRAAGIAVPADVSLTGFDDLEVASMITPTLTTLRVPTRELGEAAAAAMLKIVSGDEATCCQEIAVDLVVRETTAPPRAR